MRRSDDRRPDEIEKERAEDQDEDSYKDERQRSGDGFGRSCQQPFYSPDERRRLRVLRDPAARIVHPARRGLVPGLAARQDQSRHAEDDPALPRDHRRIEERQVRWPARRDSEGLGEPRGAPHLVAALQSQQRFDPTTDRGVGDDQEPPWLADGRTIHLCLVPLHRPYVEPPPAVRWPGTAWKRLYCSCRSGSSSPTITSPSARDFVRSSIRTLTSRSSARPPMARMPRARRSSFGQT